jgi:hypothetical protein
VVTLMPRPLCSECGVHNAVDAPGLCFWCDWSRRNIENGWRLIFEGRVFTGIAWLIQATKSRLVHLEEIERARAGA